MVTPPPTTPRHTVHPDIYNKKLLFSMSACYTDYMFTYCFFMYGHIHKTIFSDCQRRVIRRKW